MNVMENPKLSKSVRRHLEPDEKVVVKNKWLVAILHDGYV
ncbi:hypothetical protein TSIB_1447 [Thermococcus sibiricus MM 739]|uniref:Uncharacterized protein n=1 Tax=Thermococcus sibiricus (strain DSM 12597 / MM 739) TaxID=604354 RepID=C6A4F3_THESM|nr:hypothetical protein TSIB_1447 [Thermococcus sibiricus MM 739]